MEASSDSDKTRQHRLNCGGNRQANNALYCVVITRMRSIDRPRTTSPAAAPKAKSTGEIVRILKRYVAREALKQLRPLAVT